jgi:hypothetical protein
VGDREPDRGGLCGRVVLGLERLDQMPRDDPAREPPAGEPDDALGQRLGADATQLAAKPNVGANQAKLPIDVGELEVVHAHDLRAVGVDDLLVEEISGEPQGVWGKLRLGGRLKAVAKAEVTDLLREVAPTHDLLAGRR